MDDEPIGLRDLFASAALQGLIASYRDTDFDVNYKHVSSQAFAIADECMLARNNQPAKES